MNFRLALTLLALMLSGCGDPLKDYINKKWPPVTVGEQRLAAITTAATTLSKMGTPNVAANFEIGDIAKVLAASIDKKFGVQSVNIAGEEQLLRADVQFSKVFNETDALNDPSVEKILKELRPKVEGKIIAYFGATSGSIVDKNPREIALQVLPVLNSITVEKVDIAGKLDVTVIGDAVARLLTKYADNISGEISRSPSMRVLLPSEIGDSIDPTQTIAIADKSAQGTVKVTGAKVTSPVRLQAVAWLITDKSVRAIAQLLPVAAANPTDDLKIEPTFIKIKDRVEAITKESFGVTDQAAGNWAAIRKDLIALVLNGVVEKAQVCIDASAEMAPQTVGTRVEFPDPSGMDCTPDSGCYSTRSCDGINANRDTRDCNACLLWKPKICAFGGCVGGGCGLRGNDPACEAAKVAQNLIYEADAAGRRLDCERLKLQENAACEVTRAGKKALCETEKGTLQLLRNTGNFANIDVTTRAKTNGLRACLTQFAMAPDLSNVQLALDIRGSATAQIGMKFTPLDIVGHLACQFPWTEDKSFSAELRESKVALSSSIQITNDASGTRMLFSTSEQTLPLRLNPSPSEFLLTSVNMTLACQGLNLVKAFAVPFMPFIPQLRGEIDYRLPSQNVAIGIPLPTQKVGDQSIVGTLSDTGKALAVYAKLQKK